jgi:trans-2,3-dihydro-3-hydroxyanthranilate isomerase
LTFQFYLVDVFAEGKLQGNQLAVYFADEALSGEMMQRLALEMNLSETTFVTAQDTVNRVFKVRIFTTGSELPFAGHPTLGTAYVIQQIVLKAQVPELTLDLKAGKIPVRFNYLNGKPDVIWMKQLNPQFGHVYDPKEHAEVLGVKLEDIDTRYPIQDVSTGVWFTMVPIKTRGALVAIRASAKLSDHSKNPNARTPFVFCTEPVDPMNQLKVRLIGVGHEDPATGSANGCLAGYLVKYRVLGSDRIDVRVEQGAEVNRPSILYLKAEKKGDEIDVNVGGKVYFVARGELI